jgi:hypothetical protein
MERYKEVKEKMRKKYCISSYFPDDLIVKIVQTLGVDNSFSSENLKCCVHEMMSLANPARCVRMSSIFLP